jgi:hypothetical protein
MKCEDSNATAQKRQLSLSARARVQERKHGLVASFFRKYIYIPVRYMAEWKFNCDHS